MSTAPKPVFVIASMKPSTKTIATGSLNPDSPSSTRASRRGMLEPRSTENTAAASVDATIDPSSSPSSVLRSSSQTAAKPTTTAVRMVPANASETLGPSTGRISPQPAASPPSNRISARAITPIVRASSTSWGERPKSIRPSPSDPIAIPRPRNSTRPGTRSRPATSVAAIPNASSAPASRISVPSLMERRLAHQVGQRPERVPLEVRLVGAGARLALAVDPGRAEAHPLCGPDVVLEAEGHVEHPLGVHPDLPLGKLEGAQRRLVGPGVLGHHDLVELDVELTQRVLDDRAVGV